MKSKRKFPPNVLLHKARIEHGWSQSELAERIGTTSVNISRWENGETFPSPYFRQQLVAVFEKTPLELGLLPPLEQVPRIWTVPNARNPFFTGREQLLASLHKRLSVANTAARTQSQALYGLGGIGKTQTATEYAYRYGHEYTQVFWISAASRETLVTDFLQLARQIGLPAEKVQDQQQGIHAVKSWLAANPGWLLIMDNADDLPLAQEFLPANHKGFILFTTRSQATGSIAMGVEVEKLRLSEGTLLLLRRAKLLDADAPLSQVPGADLTMAEHIVQEMDGLPLALVQAGAYIEETGCSLAGYLLDFTSHKDLLLARRSKFSLDYSESVATTWLLSLQQIEQTNPTCVEILRFCAFLAPDAIPEELIMRGMVERGGNSPEAALDRFKLNEALETLRKYSLVRRYGSTPPMLSIHRLVQTVLQQSMNSETQRFWSELTVKVVNAVFPEGDYASSANHHYYLSHVQVCATYIEQHHLYFPEAARLLFRAGAFLYFHGFYAQSRIFHQQACSIREQMLAPDPLALSESLNALALLFRVQNDYQQAEELHRRALAIREKVVGLEHPTTAESFNNLGVLYRSQQKYEQAERFLQQAFSVRKKVLGAEHPRTLVVLINLAKLYLEQRKYDQAEQLLQQAQASFEQALEPDHLLFAQNLTLQARLSYEQRNNEQAETLWKQALAIIENALGPEHLALSEILNNLSELYFLQEDYLEARSLCSRALDISEKTLGVEHPDSLAYREHLDKILDKLKA
ncbi:MAG TPA: tetratricopeptide repeat protein [Ktedonobacteraceae bacterium]|nr:tetratricopeptide repeat protein [Ktedonobacteraceae bacterium]